MCWTALERGFDVLVISDATAAADPANGEAALRTVQTEGGIFGVVGTSQAVTEALEAMPPRSAAAAAAAAAASHRGGVFAFAAAAGMSSDRPDETAAAASLLQSAAAHPAEAAVVPVRNARGRPFDVDVATTALVMIDWQGDFLSADVGFAAALGCDVSPATAAIPAGRVGSSS